jgi:hypothetical protein
LAAENPPAPLSWFRTRSIFRRAMTVFSDHIKVSGTCRGFDSANPSTSLPRLGVALPIHKFQVFKPVYPLLLRWPCVSIGSKTPTTNGRPAVRDRFSCRSAAILENGGS